MVSVTSVGTGAVVSTVTVTPPLAADTFPAASVAVAVMVCAACDRADVVIDQLPPTAVAEPTRVTPS